MRARIEHRRAIARARIAVVLTTIGETNGYKYELAMHNALPESPEYHDAFRIEGEAAPTASPSLWRALAASLPFNALPTPCERANAEPGVPPWPHRSMVHAVSGVHDRYGVSLRVKRAHRFDAIRAHRGTLLSRLPRSFDHHRAIIRMPTAVILRATGPLL